MPGLRFSYFLRKCPVARHRPRWLRIASTLPYSILLNRYRFRHGLEISVESEIEPELYISHFGRLVVRPKCILGSNVNLSSGVVIGQTNRGRKQGVPVIGNYV
jgi:serine O-acetyltransferase